MRGNQPAKESGEQRVRQGNSKNGGSEAKKPPAASVMAQGLVCKVSAVRGKDER